MSNNAVGIIFSSLNDATLSCLTTDRTVAAIPFASRYRLIDFCLSNFINADIYNINVVANYNYRSLVDHIGSGKDFDLARREGGINFISPYHTSRSSVAKLFTTHLEALIGMSDYIDGIKEDFVIMMDSDHVINVDLRSVLRSHVNSARPLTVATVEIDKDCRFKSERMMIQSRDNLVTDISMSNTFMRENPELCINLYVINTEYLKKLIREAVAYRTISLTGLLLKRHKTDRFHRYKYDGYMACVSDLYDYYKASIELATNESRRAMLFGKKDYPIYTRVHNSSPTMHMAASGAKNSIIADECVIEGEVVNSVIFRNVHIEKGAVVKNSVLFHGTHVGKNSSLNCIVTDKHVYLSEGVILSGDESAPFYIEKGRKI